MVSKSLPELLAPAGSMDSLKAAVNAGADAVYLSGKSYGARYYAGNFNKAQMEEALDYAHLRGLKVYITVNTLIKDFELEKVAEYLFWLYQMGADAVIMQDVGVASICRELVPELDMHASTQMTINSLEAVKWAHDFGFKRVVLAREMTLPEVEEITQKMGDKIEVEIFAHGALCYSYSGQCLLSSVIGGRSGNRGRCAQPCRKPYELLKGRIDKYGKLLDPVSISLKENYLLSTRDLALYNKLDRISNLAVDSLKIEGRMRSPEYVALVVCIYRRALNALMQGKWIPDDKDLIRLKLAFNRGFTKGYLLEANKEQVMAREAPGNRGLYLGTVLSPGKRINEHRNKSTLIKLDSRLIGLKNRFKLEKADGIVFIPPDADENRYGMAIEETPKYLGKNHEKLLLKTRKPVSPGSEIYMTRDISLINSAQAMIHEDRNKLSIPLDIRMKWDKEDTPRLEGKFRGPLRKIHEIDLKADFKMEPAIKSPLSKEKIVNQLIKTGGTSFNIRNIEIDYPGNLFTPLSKLNKIRREFINKAESELLNDFRPTGKCVESAGERLVKIKRDLKSSSGHSLNKDESLRDAEIPMNMAVYASSLDAIKGALRGGCRRIYFEPFLWEHYGRELPCEVNDWNIYTERIQELLLSAHELCKAEEATLIWKWPSITRNGSLKNLSPLVNSLFDEDIREIMVDNMGAFRAINNINPQITLHGSAGLNISNHRTAYEFSDVLNSITLSNELSKEELISITGNFKNVGTNTSFEFLVQGNLESMISEDCLPSIASRSYQEIPGEFWGIKDIKNRIFPVVIDDEGRTHILNSVELCLIDHLPDLYQVGLQHLVIDARNKTRDYARDMIELYLQGLEYFDKNDENRKYLNKLKNRAKKISQGGITTGNFHKGLN